MKKILITLILSIICTPVFAEDMPWLYNQSSSPTTTINTTTTTNTIQTNKDIKIKMKSNSKSKIIQPSSWTSYKNTQTINDSTSNTSNNTTTNNSTFNTINNGANSTTNTSIIKNNNGVTNKFGLKQDYLYVDNVDNSSAENMNAIALVLLASVSDPYMVKINGKKYYIIKDSKNGVYNFNNIVGYRDKRSSLFTALKQLNTDSDKTKLTSTELKKQNIRFVYVSPDNKLQLKNYAMDYDLNNVVYIDLGNTRESINNGTIGSFGYFDMYIKDNYGRTKKVIGCVTFETDDELKAMMGIK